MNNKVYKYGIDITNATLQTYAYQLGLSKAVSEMTQMEKMQLRTIAILDQSKVSWGDLANTIESPSNMVRQFKNNLSELGIMIGQLFIPVLQKVLPYINGFTIALKRLMDSIANTLGIKLDLSSFGQGYTEMEESIDDVTDAYEEATKAANKFKSATIGIDKLNIISPPEDNKGSSAGSSAVPSIDLTDEIKKATEEYEKVWNKAYEKMQSKAQLVADNITKALEPIKTIINDFAVGDFFKAGQDVSSLVTSINLFLAKAIQSVDWEKVGNDIGLFLKGLDWTAILSSVGLLFWQALNAAIDLWKGSFEIAPIETVLITAFAALNLTPLGGILVSKIISAITNKLRLPAHIIATNFGASLLKAIKALKFKDIMLTLPSNIALITSPGGIHIGNEILEALEKAVDVVMGKGFNEKYWDIFWRNVLGPAWNTFDKSVKDGLSNAQILKKLVELLIPDLSLTKYWWNRYIENTTQAAMSIQKEDYLDAAKHVVQSLLDALLAALELIVSPLKKGFTNWMSVWMDNKEDVDSIIDNFINNITGGISDGIDGIDDNSLRKKWEKKYKSIFKSDNFDFVIDENWDPKSGKSPIISITPSWTAPKYATGGFPEDGLFYANHNELVGQFANGKTAVANNAQIVDGIKYGVKQAMMEAMANGGFGGGETTIHNHIALDGREVAQNTNKFNSTRGKQIFGNQTNYNFA